MSASLTSEIAVAAARLIVEHGMEYGPAKKRAAKTLAGRGRSIDLPGNDRVEDEVRAYLDIFHADTQPADLAALRGIAVEWMRRLAAFRPHLTGAVWRGTATRLSSIRIELYCDDSKAAELALIDMRIPYDATSVDGPRGRQHDVLNLFLADGPATGGVVHLALMVLDYDDLRGALRSDAKGRPERGDLAAAETLLPPLP